VRRPRAAAGRRRAARQALVQPFERHQLEQFLAARDAVGALHAPDAQRELDVVGHGHVAKQRVVLETQADAAIAGPDVGHVAPVQRNAAVIDAGESAMARNSVLLPLPEGPAARKTRLRRPLSKRR
jgi:hypothetical protein